MQRQVEVGGGVGINTEELRWCSADDREGKIVNQYRFADTRSSSALMSRPAAGGTPRPRK